MQVSSPTATTVVTNVTGCFGDASGAIDLAIIDGQAPFTYTWSNGETTEDLDSLAVGLDTCTITSESTSEAVHPCASVTVRL